MLPKLSIKESWRLSFERVDSHMLSVGDDLEVFYSIIQTVSVLVVNDLGAQQWPANVFRHDVSMLIFPATAAALYFYLPVPIAIAEMLSFGAWQIAVICSRAEQSRKSGSPFGSPFAPRRFSDAVADLNFHRSALFFDRLRRSLVALFE